MRYNFKESQLSANFCDQTLNEVRRRLHPSGFFTIVGMPGVGISFFMRYLATKDIATCISIDTLSLIHPTKRDFYTALLKEMGRDISSTDEQTLFNCCQEQLQILLKKEKHIVFLFNRFDELEKEIDKNFLGNLRTLRHNGADKVSMIFSTHKTFYELSELAVSGANLDMFSNILYFQPYEKKDMLQLLSLHSSELMENTSDIDQLLNLTGGHYQLTRLALKSSRKNSLLFDRFILSSLKTIYKSLSYQQKRIVQTIAFQKKVKIMDDELLHFGIVRKYQEEYSLFSPLFMEYIITYSAIKLPAKEKKLFTLLKKNLGKVVEKELIFQTLWRENDEEFGSDWALNALIYRLRKNPTFIATGYLIESYKKIGYMMIRN